MLKLDFLSYTYAQYFTDEVVGPEELTDSEKLLIGNFSPKRLRDFCTGRFCARQALSTFGYNQPDILVGNSNEPLWPEGIVGSLSHSGQLTGAIVGLSSHFLSIGIDIETIGKINTDMWDLLYTHAEQRYLKRFTGEVLAYYTTLLFSFKESFYKMQHLLTGTFLEFTDVEVNLRGESFEITVLKEFIGKNNLLDTVSLYQLQQKNQIITLCYLVNNNNTII
jgi:4'-phosphopantetheinyl transferase EntD